MGIRLGNTPITLPGIAKVMYRDKRMWQKTVTPTGPVNYTLTQKSVLEHDTANGTYNSICKIDDTHFIVAYTGADDDGYISTFSIDPNNDYAITEIDSLEYDAVRSTHPSLIQIDSTHFILAYSGDNFAVTIVTFSIDANYDNITVIDSLACDTGSNNGNDTSLVMLDSSRFVVAFSGSGSDGYIRTLSIDESYNISAVALLEHDTTSGRYNSLIALDSTHVVLAYSQPSAYYGYLKSFYISSDLNTITTLKSANHNTPSSSNSLIKIDATHLMLAYRDTTDNKSRLITISIDGSYDFSVIDTYEYDASYAHISLCTVDSTHFILTYAGVDSDGFIITFSIDGSYDITQIDVLEHDTSNGTYNALVLIDSTHVVLAYAGADDDAYVKVFELD